jgi:hypothetical protein
VKDILWDEKRANFFEGKINLLYVESDTMGHNSLAMESTFTLF